VEEDRREPLQDNRKDLDMTPEQPADPVLARTIEEQAAGVAYRLINSDWVAWPFPHCLLRDILPRPLFQGLRSLDLLEESLSQKPLIEGVSAAEHHRYSLSVTSHDLTPDSAVDPLLRHTYQVLAHPIARWAMTRVFARALVAAFGRADLPLSATMQIVEDRSGYALLPHTDVPHKAVTLLIYLAQDDDDPTLGTELYTPSSGVTLTGGYPMRGRFKRGPFTRVATAPYRPNAGIIFAPSERSFHGVSSVEGENRTRRIIQFQLSVDDPAIRRIDDPKKPA
jgi:hypothetical protein